MFTCMKCISIFVYIKLNKFNLVKDLKLFRSTKKTAFQKCMNYFFWIVSLLLLDSYQFYTKIFWEYNNFVWWKAVRIQLKDFQSKKTTPNQTYKILPLSLSTNKELVNFHELHLEPTKLFNIVLIPN